MNSNILSELSTFTKNDYYSNSTTLASSFDYIYSYAYKGYYKN